MQATGSSAQGGAVVGAHVSVPKVQMFQHVPTALRLDIIQASQTAAVHQQQGPPVHVTQASQAGILQQMVPPPTATQQLLSSASASAASHSGLPQSGQQGLRFSDISVYIKS